MAKRFLLKTLGCRLNVAELMEVERKLRELGWRRGDKPDLVVINTCSVTHKADKESRQLIRQLKRKYPKARMVVTGCFVGGIHPLKLAKDLKSKGYSSLAAMISDQRTLIVNNMDKDNLVEILKNKGWV